jgi:hypothetical protein
MSRTKAQQAEQADAIAQLREWIKPGDTVYTLLEHVSRSGMQREIRVLVPYVVRDGECKPGNNNGLNTRVDFIHPNHAISKALGMRQGKRDGLIVGGCGMDMGFHLVYELSHALYGARRVKLNSGGQFAVPQGNADASAGDGYAWEGGYQCLGPGKCPSNYHVNHRERVRCEGADGRFCWKPDRWSSRFPIPEGWPMLTRTLELDGETVTLETPAACLSTPAGDDPEGQQAEVCPTCGGVGDLPNPAGPERWDLVHTDGYALRHKWL